MLWTSLVCFNPSSPSSYLGVVVFSARFALGFTYRSSFSEVARRKGGYLFVGSVFDCRHHRFAIQECNIDELKKVKAEEGSDIVIWRI